MEIEDTEPTEFISGNVFIRKMMRLVDAGFRIAGHTHQFDHTTIVFSGAIRVKFKLPGGQIGEHDYHAPNHFLVRKEVEHEITALKDGTTVWCVYSHRDPQGEVVQIATGWPVAYV
jgi:hypothetical protein